MTRFNLDDLAAIISARANATAAASYTKSLLDAGPSRTAKKLGEEAVEVVIAAMVGDAQAITRAPKTKPEGQFTLLVPDLTDARSFHFFGPAVGPRERSARSGELIAHTIEELRQFRADASNDAAQQSAEEALS